MTGMDALGEAKADVLRWVCRQCGTVTFTPRDAEPPKYCTCCGRKVVVLDGDEADDQR